MKHFRRILRVFVAVAMVIGAIETGAMIGVPAFSGYSAPAEAVVGRPLTPVSVAGVARRTVRRCAVGIYDC
jgi:hypothetical protein